MWAKFYRQDENRMYREHYEKETRKHFLSKKDKWENFK